MIPPDDAETFFRSLDREVWVVTSGDHRVRGGLLATWVMQATLSVDRPVLLAGIAPNHHTAKVIDRTGRMAVHLLREDQVDLGLQMASSSGHNVDKLDRWRTSSASESLDVPVLDDCLAWAAGQVFGRLDAGDRVFYWVEAEAMKPPSNESGPPLRQSRLLAAAPDEVKRVLRADRVQDMLRHAPMHEAWRELIMAGESRVTNDR